IVVVYIEYDGRINTDMSGFYVNKHIDINGNEIRSAVTQFEPTNARRMLPCLDEPELKATFEVSVIREKAHMVRSNMHLIKTEPFGDGLSIDHFARSVRMSTYLLAVAVLNNYDCAMKITNKTKSPIEINLCATSAMLVNQSEFGLTSGLQALEFFESYFDLPYPLKKQDMIALDDFAEGAMENWGMTTYRDILVLLNEEKSSAKSKETIALVICHEYAHQWFGNLVTMKWWNDLWLNEGFANFMEYVCTDHSHPEWEIMHTFYLSNYVSGMLADGFHSSHAVSTKVTDPAQIGAIFDAISYQKVCFFTQYANRFPRLFFLSRFRDKILYYSQPIPFVRTIIMLITVRWVMPNFVV
ncbi:hypothetical protein AB6A40_009724, partial [Gnathostoma spinigerum]